MSDTRARLRRLIEADLPILEISKHARRERNIPHGQAAGLHIWWARRPLAACRAVMMAALIPDPVDARCPDDVVQELRAALNESSKADRSQLRTSLLGFIATFASWEGGIDAQALKVARRLVEIAARATGGGVPPRVFDPFAGGGSIPIEGARVGAEVVASDLNPVAVLLNRVAVELVPRFGDRLRQAVEDAGARIGSALADRLRPFYATSTPGETAVAYLWARTIRCEGPACGCLVPLVRGTWLVRKGSRKLAVAIKSDASGLTPVLIENPRAAEVTATIRRGAARCLACSYTTPVESVRRQLAERNGGTRDAFPYAVVTTRATERTRNFRAPSVEDNDSYEAAVAAFDALLKEKTEAFPNEPLPPVGALGFRIQRYGLVRWGDLYSPRQGLALITVAGLIEEEAARHEGEFGAAVQTILALAFDRLAEVQTSLCRWNATIPTVQATFGRQAMPIVWDFVETSPIGGVVGSWSNSVELVLSSWRSLGSAAVPGTARQADAAKQLLPDDSADLLFTDPPYYDAVPYSDLSDFFYVWLRRLLPKDALLQGALTPKDDECIVDPSKEKDAEFFRQRMASALVQSRRALRPGGIGVLVFAHKSTSAWDAQLQAMIEAGWVITGSWPIDTEMGSRLRARNSAALGSSVHLVCRPRERDDGELDVESVGDWRAVLAELPARIHDWLPRLAKEGVAGADALFACLGPALEIFSRFSRVEKASGDAVALSEYLEQVWAAISREALEMVFSGAETAGLEPDARVSAMILWTISSPGAAGDVEEGSEGSEGNDDEEENTNSTASGSYVIEYDAARKIAQGLGASLEDLSSVLEVKGQSVRLRDVTERAEHLFSTAVRLPNARRKPQTAMFDEDEEGDDVQLGAPVGTTTLDRVHQAMLFFSRGSGDALKRLLVDDGVGRTRAFWKLAQALSALYPPSSPEKRWVDGVLARKKGLGF